VISISLQIHGLKFWPEKNQMALELLEFLPEIFKNSGLLQSTALSKFQPEKLTNTSKRPIDSAPTVFWISSTLFHNSFCQILLMALALFDTQNLTNSTIESPVKMEYGWNFSISGLKMMVKSGFKKYFGNSSMRSSFSIKWI
jgi:hypothetical protein